MSNFNYSHVLRKNTTESAAAREAIIMPFLYETYNIMVCALFVLRGSKLNINQRLSGLVFR